METDWSAGEITRAVDAAGLREKTLIIFTSDNGCAPYAGVEHLEGSGHYPSAHFRGYKSDIWEGGHRIPFIARWPGKIKADSHSDQIVCLSDLLATCADLLQAQLPDNAAEDSVSLVPALLRNDRKPLHEAIVNHSATGRFAIRKGNWKLELCPGSGGWGLPGDAAAFKDGLPIMQLYDMHNDIGEKTNIEGKNAGVVTNMLNLLKQYVADGRSTPGVKQTNDVSVDLWKKQLNDPKRTKGANDRRTAVSD